ncbi:uncharacterized protein [Amphiura filiformis]|uniref:uncharacterized protein n=1 Tax=Amphiura filiformis TaxID=82378 RepID=UPI003B2212E4
MNEQEPHKTDAKEIQTEVDGKERSRDDESGNVTVIGAMEEEKSGDTRITALPSSQQSEQVDVQNTSQSQDTGGDDVEKRLENLSCNTKTGREEVATVDEEVVDIGVQNDVSKEMELHEGGKTGDEVVETVVQNDSKDVELDEEQKTEDLGNKQISEKRIVEVGENEKDAIKDFEGSDGKEQDSLLDTEKKDSKEMQIPVVANIEGENSTSTVAVFKNVDFIVNEKVVAMERPLIEELEERKDLACNKCSAKFSKVVHAIEHRRLHHGVKPFTCSYCAFQAAQESVVRTHVFRKHQLILRGTSTNKLIHDSVTNTFSCPFCPSPKVKFLLLKDAEEHLKSQHVFLEDQQYVCYVCGLESTVRKDIVNHALYSRCKHKNQEASTDKIVKKVAQDIVELSHKYTPAEEWHEMLHPDVIIDSQDLGDKNQDKENRSNSAQNDTKCKIVELDAAADAEKMQFKCTLCDFASVQRRKVYYHIIDSHKRCQRDCYDTYTYVIGEVEQNISLSRNPITGLYHCPFCDEVSKRQSTGVIVHIRAIHSKERPYKCKYCSYDSVSWSEIFSHGKAWHDVEIHSMIKQIPFFEYVSSLDEKSIANDGMEVEGSSQTETKSKTVEQKEMSRDKSWVVEESWTAGFGTSFTIKKKGLGSGSSSGTSNNEEAVKSNAGTSNNEETMETNTAAKPDTKITNAARLKTDDTEAAEVDHNIREIFQKANLNVDYIINISDIEKLAVSDAQLSRLHFCDKCDIVIQGMGPDMIFYSGHGCKEDDLVWFCCHCICGFKNKAELVDHLKAKHSIDHKSSGVTLQLNQALLHHLVRHTYEWCIYKLALHLSV